jgi:hypothetical protein
MNATRTAIAVVSLLAAAPTAHASIIRALSLTELVGESNAVVVGSVETSRVRRDEHGRIVTDHTLRVDERWKGEAATGDLLVVTTFGGTIGEVAMRTEGEATLSQGGRYVLFLREWHEGHGVMRPVGMSQGVLAIRDGAAEGGDDLVLPGGAGLAIVLPGGDGTLRAAPPAFFESASLSATRARVETEVEAQRGR